MGIIGQMEKPYSLVGIYSSTIVYRIIKLFCGHAMLFVALQNHVKITIARFRVQVPWLHKVSHGVKRTTLMYYFFSATVVVVREPFKQVQCFETLGCNGP